MAKGNSSQITPKSNEEGCEFKHDREETIETACTPEPQSLDNMQLSILGEKRIEDVVPIASNLNNMNRTQILASQSG